MNPLIAPSSCVYYLNYEVPFEYQYSFQSIFAYIKKKIQLKNARKSNIDSMLKKCKGKFFKAIHDAIKLCLNLLVRRIPQKFITNITIEFNQQNIYKRIIDIYTEYTILPSLEEIQEKQLLRKGKENLFKEIAECRFVDLYNVYLTSDRYKSDTEKIKTKEGQRFYVLYEFVSKNFLTYYLYGKAHNVKDKELSQKEEGDNKNKKTMFVIRKMKSYKMQGNLFD